MNAFLHFSLKVLGAFALGMLALGLIRQFTGINLKQYVFKPESLLGMGGDNGSSTAANK